GFRIVATEGHAQAPMAPAQNDAPPTSTTTSPTTDTSSSAPLTTSNGATASSGCHRPIGFIALIAFGIWFLFRPRRRDDSATPLSKNTATTWSSRVKLRPAADGFRILAPPSLEGGSLRYTYNYNGTVKTGDIALAPALD